MKNLDIRRSSILKMMCYVLIPIFLIILAVNIGCAVYEYENPEIKQKEYYNSNIFSDRYLSKIYEIENRAIYKFDYNFSSIVNEEGETIYYEMNSKDNFNYLILYNDNVYTNIKCTMDTDSTKEIKDYIGKNKYYWNFDNIVFETVLNSELEKNQQQDAQEATDLLLKEEEFIQNTGAITTNIENLNLNNTRYSDLYKELNGKNISMYTSLPEQLEQRDYFYFEELLYNIVKEGTNNIYINIIIFIIAIIAMICYLIKATGYQKGYEGIKLNWFDKIPLEIIGISLGISFIVGVKCAAQISVPNDRLLACIGFVIIYISIILAFATTTKRMKANTYLKNTIIFKIYKKIKEILKIIFKQFHFTVKLGLVYSAFLIGTMLCIMIFKNNGWVIIILPVYFSVVFYYLLKYTQGFIKIKQSLKNIYEGNVEKTLKLDDFKGELKQTATYVNDIAGGFSNAIEENLKSERLKTELITNVSHDIKTPLTSIINYVDLLKKEDIQNEKAQEYIKVLDNKSQRLKKLIEDLVEASKAASGNIKLNIEKINISELTMQATGEFEEKFKKRGLEVIVSIPEETIQVDADSRYMYRIYENILTNIEKYALENSRVYIDIKSEKNKVTIAFKNISKDELNISADELMQRFVRGDKSRTTEGSGLGIAIAKSLTEIQNGKFNMILDGDLFKVVIEFEMSKEDVS